MSYDQWKTRDPNEPFADHEEDGPTELDMVYEDNDRLRKEVAALRSQLVNAYTAIRSALVIAEAEWHFKGAHPCRQVALEQMRAALIDDLRSEK